MKIYQYIVSYDDINQRLDGFLAGKIGIYSTRKIKSMIDAGLVDVNGKRQKIASYTVVMGDKIKLHDPALATEQKVQHPILKEVDIIFDAEEFVVINKPPGLASQQTKDPKFPHVLSLLEAYYKSKEIILASPMFLVHRLDLETSGVLFVAKTARCATYVTDQFRNRDVKKIYLAICHGRAVHQSFIERAPLSDIDKKTGDVRPVRVGGNQAVTEFKVIDQREDTPLTLMECQPKTGRSHQIRVHLDLNSLPILGDKRYGSSKRRLLPQNLAIAEAQAALFHCLHAFQLTLRPLPNLDSQVFNAPLPTHFREIMKVLFPKNL